MSERIFYLYIALYKNYYCTPDLVLYVPIVRDARL